VIARLRAALGTVVVLSGGVPREDEGRGRLELHVVAIEDP
jgi:hypothetical protein